MCLLVLILLSRVRIPPAFDLCFSISSPGGGAVSCFSNVMMFAVRLGEIEKNEGRACGFARPSLRGLCLPCVVLDLFLSAANDASVLSDFKIAVCGFTEAGFAVLIRVEGHRDCVVVGVGAVIVVLAVLLFRVLKKHFFVFLFLFSLVPCFSLYAVACLILYI